MYLFVSIYGPLQWLYVISLMTSMFLLKLQRIPIHQFINQSLVYGDSRIVNITGYISSPPYAFIACAKITLPSLQPQNCQTHTYSKEWSGIQTIKSAGYTNSTPSVIQKKNTFSDFLY
jgi:hypothetical protein